MITNAYVSVSSVDRQQNVNVCTNASRSMKVETEIASAVSSDFARSLCVEVRIVVKFASSSSKPSDK